MIVLKEINYHIKVMGNITPERIQVLRQFLKNKEFVKQLMWQFEGRFYIDGVQTCESCDAALGFLPDVDTDMFHESNYTNKYIRLDSVRMNNIKFIMDHIEFEDDDHISYDLRMHTVRYCILTSPAYYDDDINFNLFDIVKMIVRYKLTTKINDESTGLNIIWPRREDMVAITNDAVIYVRENNISRYTVSELLMDSLCVHRDRYLNWGCYLIMDQISSIGIQSLEQKDHYIQQYTLAALDLIKNIDAEKDDPSFDINEMLWKISFKWNVVHDHIADYKVPPNIPGVCNPFDKIEMYPLTAWFCRETIDENLAASVSRDNEVHIRIRTKIELSNVAYVSKKILSITNPTDV